jgi:hypothetical protein
MSRGMFVLLVHSYHNHYHYHHLGKIVGERVRNRPTLITAHMCGKNLSPYNPSVTHAETQVHLIYVQLNQLSSLCLVHYTVVRIYD